MSYFTDAVSNLTTQVAYKDAIRRLYDKGLSIDEIIKNCTYPVNEDIVNNVIRKYEQSKTKPKATYVEEYDKSGRKTFRKI
ncbi:MAG: hypothetical protein Q4D29_04230 [Lachnospiraceae bacterium]|nr:hypothetical protein [Lachnospiraceae bacterium]